MKRGRSCLFAACVIVFLLGPAMSAGPANLGAGAQPASTGNQGTVRYEVDLAARKWLREVGKDRSKLGHLVKYAGSSDYYSVLNDPAVLAQLRVLLGAELSHLFQNFDTIGTIDLVSSELELSGGRAHQNDIERAFISVNVVMGTVEAIIFSHGKTTVYSRARNYGDLHGATRMWLHMPEVNAALARPPKGNVVFAR